MNESLKETVVYIISFKSKGLFKHKQIESRKMSFNKNRLFKGLLEFEIQWEKGTIKSFKSLENPNLTRY